MKEDCQFTFHDNFSEMEDILSACTGLVIVDEEKKVRLVHFTTQEYFLRTWEKWFPTRQFEMTRACVTYLCFDAFDNECHSEDADIEERLQLYPFYTYVAVNWGFHV